MANDSKGMGIPLPADNTPIAQFPKAARAMGEKVAEILAGGITEQLEATVAGSVSKAVGTELDRLDVVRGDDERLPDLIQDRPGWSHVDVDGDGLIISGIRTDGSQYIRDLDSPSVLSNDDERLPAPITDIPEWSHVDVDGAGNVIAGIRTDGTYYFRSLDTPQIAPAESPRIAVFGDSMAGDHGGTGVSIAKALATVTGLEVFAGGVPGQTSTEVALRQGGLDVFITAPGNVLPAPAAPVSVQITEPAGMWKTGSAWTFTGTLAGVIGQLKKDAADAWTFTRAAAGAAVQLQPETRWISTEGAARRDWVQIWRSGRNNVNGETIARDERAMRAGLSGSNNRFLVLPTYNSATEPAGSAGYVKLAAINKQRADTYGPNYYDLRGWMIRNGLAAAGLTPTAEDLAAIAEDRLPPALMYDAVHLTALGRTVEARRLAQVITDKGWI